MKSCTNCQQSFEITDFESDFHQKVGVPSPTHCPLCRMQRRTAFRNESKFYKRTCDLSSESIVSLYHPESPYKVYKVEKWFSDEWNAMEYGQDFDFSKPFFEQFHELSLKVPKPSLTQINNENSPYTTGTGYCKNCYMINSSEYAEDCYYSKLVQSSRDIVNSSYVYDSELCYECFNIRNCYHCTHIYNSQDSTDCYFSDNLNGCTNCTLCTNLSKKKYHFLNKPVGKEEYEKRIEELQNYQNWQKALTELHALRAKKICKYANVINCQECTGDFLRNSKNCTECYDVSDSEDSMYVQVGVKVKSLLDCSNMYIDPEFCYEVMSVIGINNVHFSTHIFHSHDIFYGDHCHNSHDLFGCSGLRNKKYCILNKQYSKEEYEDLKEKIITHMKNTKEWGEFFPIQFSTFPYNETLGHEYIPMSKQEVLKKRWNWRDAEEADLSGVTKRIPASKLPDRIDDIPDDILSWAIECEESEMLFKIQKSELELYRKQKFPVPHFHPDIRHTHRMNLRNPRKLYDRKCNKCGADIQTTYSSKRPETIYCEECYLTEVY